MIMLTLMCLCAHVTTTEVFNGAVQFSVPCYNCAACRGSGAVLAIANDTTSFIMYSSKDLEAVWPYVCRSHK